MEKNDRCSWAYLVWDWGLVELSYLFYYSWGGLLLLIEYWGTVGYGAHGLKQFVIILII